MLTIEVISYRNRPMQPRLVQGFDERGGMIGRSETSRLVLDDPEAHERSVISRDHARIAYRQGHYVVVDNGSNPLLYNNRALGKGKEARLGNGDQLRIGDYVLLCHIDQLALPHSAAIGSRQEPVLGTDTPRVSGIDTIVSERSIEQISQIASTRKPQTDLKFESTASEDLSASRQSELESLDEWLNASSVTSECGRMQAAAANRPRQGEVVVSWPKGQGIQPSALRNAAPMDDSTRAAFAAAGTVSKPKAHPVSNMAPVATTAPQYAAQSSGQVAPDALTKAFLAGAGLPQLKLPNGLDAETVFLIGQLMSAVVSGMLQLLKVRSETKRELGAPVTIVRPYVNPLKFSPNAEFALQQLLAPQSEGFMPSLEAVEDAFADLIAHQAGVLAGLDAAMNALIDRFTPENLERQLLDKGMFSSVIPFIEKAKLWDLFETKFDDIKDSARDGVDNVFRTEFVRAYEGKTTELRRARTLPESRD